MGSFYTNVMLYGSSQQRQIADFLQTQKRTSYVSPTVDGFTIVYDKETENQDTDVLNRIAEMLSKEFKCTGLASLVHDSDIYMYWLYENGKLTDTYNSLPDYFDDEDSETSPEGGDPERLCMAFGKSALLPDLIRFFEAVQNDDGLGNFLFGEDIHAELVNILGMPAYAAHVGFHGLENDGHLPRNFSQNHFIKVSLP